MATDLTQAAPDLVIASGDPGDDTARRYRFQYYYAATVCCRLLDELQGITEVFCEHHEDVLLKHEDGRFTALQVKTRETNQPVWKANDEQVLGAFVRFVRLDIQFPDAFREFRFLTNHPLLASKSASSLTHLLEEIRIASKLGNLSSSSLKWIQRVAKLVGCSDEQALMTLSRCHAEDSLPKLADCSMRLMETVVGVWSGAREFTHEDVKRSAQSLVEECGRASSLDHEQLLPGFLSSSSNSSEAIEARINGKRMTLARVQRALLDGSNGKAELAGAIETRADPGGGSTELLTRKLDAGGFSAVSRVSAEDLRDKADYLAITWQKKFGREIGLVRYDHIRSIALNDAARAFEAVKQSSGTFGPEMRENLRARFLIRRANSDQLYDCSDDHLEGFAYTLTSACKIQWSLKLPWETD